MRSIICFAIVIALAGLTGCAKQESAPADEAEVPTETQQISTEDFESGEVDAVVEEGDDKTETEDEPAH